MKPVGRSIGFLAALALISLPLLGQTEPAPVILVTVDTLRADYVGVYGSQHAPTPVMDQLAADGAFFENAYCQVPLTPPSHASILTGLYPPSHGLRDFTSGSIRPGLPSVATVMKSRGYQTAAFLSAFVLDRNWGLNAGFDLYADDFEIAEFAEHNPGNVQRRGEETIDRVLAWLGQVDGPYFLWIHLFDPHHDYSPPEPFRTRYSNDLYAGEVAYTDTQIGRLVDAIKKRGDYDRSLWVVVSDHGEGLGDHGEQEHGFFLYEEVLRVPLIFKLPSTVPKPPEHRIGGIAQTVDIFPTLLQILDIPQSAAPGIEGRGLFSEILGKRRPAGFAYAETLYPRTTFGWSALRAYREGPYKLISAPEAELFQLEKDPGEKQNLTALQGSVAGQYRQKLQSLESHFQGPQGVPQAQDPEAVERLKALGYAALSQPVAVSRADQDLPDPKAKLATYNQFLKGLQAAEAGALETSNQILEQVARNEPDLFIVFHSLGNNYLRAGQSERALENLNRAASLNPGFVSTRLSQARALAQLGRSSEAIEMLQGLTAGQGAPPSALRQLAQLHIQSRQIPEAIRVLNRLLSGRPQDLPARRALALALVENRDYERGLEEIDRLAESGMEDAPLSNSRGIALANLGRLEEAEAAYRKAIQKAPQFALPRLNLSMLLARTGRTEDSRKEFEALCRINAELCGRYRSQIPR